MKEEVVSVMEPLLDDLKKGDKQAFGALIYLYRKKLLLDAYYILSSMEEAEDIVQEVFVNFWRVKHNLDHNTFLGSYLSKAVRNESIVRVKKKQVRNRRHNKYLYFLESSTSSNPLENAELGRQIMKAINSLPPAQRNDFIALYLEGKTQKSIAFEQNKTVQTVKNSIHQALKTLRIKLEVLVK